MFFPTDITHLRFTRSHEQDDERNRTTEAGSPAQRNSEQLRVA